MVNHPIPLILLLLLLKTRSGPTPAIMHSLQSLQIESMIDQIHSCIHLMEKMNHFAGGEGLAALPDMKKIMEVVEKMPL